MISKISFNVDRSWGKTIGSLVSDRDILELTESEVDLLEVAVEVWLVLEDELGNELWNG